MPTTCNMRQTAKTGFAFFSTCRIFVLAKSYLEYSCIFEMVRLSFDGEINITLVHDRDDES